MYENLYVFQILDHSLPDDTENKLCQFLSPKFVVSSYSVQFCSYNKLMFIFKLSLFAVEIKYQIIKEISYVLQT
jgi:hypothetical protein